MFIATFNLISEVSGRKTILNELPYLLIHQDSKTIISYVRTLIKTDFVSFFKDLELPLSSLKLQMIIVNDNTYHMYYINGINTKEIKTILFQNL